MGSRFCTSNGYPVDVNDASEQTSLRRNFTCAFYFLNLSGCSLANHNHILQHNKGLIHNIRGSNPLNFHQKVVHTVWWNTAADPRGRSSYTGLWTCIFHSCSSLVCLLICFLVISSIFTLE